MSATWYETVRRFSAVAGMLILGASGVRGEGTVHDITRDQLQYIYGYLTDTCYLAPTPLQPETLDLAERVFQVNSGFNPPTNEQVEVLLTDVEVHLLEIAQIYPAYRVVYNGSEAVIDGTPPTLDVTRGLQRMVVADFVNTSDDVITVSGMFAEAEPIFRGDIGVLPGRSLPYLIPVLVQSGDFDTMTLTVNVSSKSEVYNLEVPVSMQQAAVLTGKTLDAGTDEVFPSRVYALGSDNIYRHARELAANTTLSEKQIVFRPAFQKIPFFYTEGEFTVDLPPGGTKLTLERGYETRYTSETLTLESGSTAEIELAAERDMDMKALGWISGDTHIHWAINAWDQNEDIDLLAMVQRAEDLRVANNLTLYQWRAPEQGGPFLKPDQYPMGPVEHLSDSEYHLEMAEEFRNDNHFGHICLLNLNELVEPVATGPGSGGDQNALDYPINKTIIEAARAQGGISVEAHNLGPFFASGVPVNVVHGLADSLDQLVPEHYYNFLNCGFRIGLSNGSDHPARLAGICRVYVRLEGDFTYEKWIRALASAKTFTTSGPLLFLDVNGADIGDELELKQGDPITVTARVWSRDPIGNLEIVSNGDVIKSVNTSETEAEVTWTGTADESRWFTARCSQSNVYDALAGPGIAHTSAIYADVDGKPVFKSQAAQGWIQNIQIHRQRLVQQGNFANDEQRQEALDYIDEGIALYERLIANDGMLDNSMSLN